MSLFHDSAIAGASGQAAGGAYKIERSLRFNSSDSAYLSRTPSTAGNRKTWTWSGWVKRSAIAATTLFSCYKGSGTVDTEYFEILYFSNSIQIAGYSTIYRFTEQVFRDPSAWYHVTLAIDTTNATAAERLKLWVNGSQVTVFSTSNALGLNSDLGVNQSSEHTIGRRSGFGAYFDGYLADIHFIDGQALDPSSFAETNITTGQWVPKAYTGTYGTNGFRLAFADNSNNTATTLGKDSSPNGNNWTPNNLSVTAGAGNDSLVDTPTSYGTDTGAGGNVRGNYATLNPLDNGGITLANGNLDSARASASWVSCRATIAISSGKWYWEFTATSAVNESNDHMLGLMKPSASLGNYPGADANGWGYISFGGTKFTSAVSSSYGASWTNGDIIGVAFDADAGTLVFYKNNATQGTAFTGLTSGPYAPALGLYGTSSGVFNFGARSFAYAAPSGFKALCDTNLPAPVVAKPNTVFDAVLYTANVSGGKTISMPGGFSPDLVWIKNRDNVEQHYLADTVRGDGSNKYLRSNSTNAEGGVIAGDCSITFGSSGFTLTDPDFTGGELYFQNRTYVSWNWDAGSSTVTNTQGSITSQVRANASAGFSIVTYTGTGSNATVGHGLGVNPGLIIVKSRSNASWNWGVYHQSLSGPLPFLSLNTTNAASTNTFDVFIPANNSSTVFGIGTEVTSNQSAGTYVAYCFAPVAGYSSFGSYTGNGSTDGPFVFCNFRPRWILVKSTGATGWAILDTGRSSFNQANNQLFPHDAGAEFTSSTDYFNADILSNGFKLRSTSSASNSNGQTYIYAAFAENTFQYARAR